MPATESPSCLEPALADVVAGRPLPFVSRVCVDTGIMGLMDSSNGDYTSGISPGLSKGVAVVQYLPRDSERGGTLLVYLLTGPLHT